MRHCHSDRLEYVQALDDEEVVSTSMQCRSRTSHSNVYKVPGAPDLQRIVHCVEFVTCKKLIGAKFEGRGLVIANWEGTQLETAERLLGCASSMNFTRSGRCSRRSGISYLGSDNRQPVSLFFLRLLALLVSPIGAGKVSDMTA
jgi:hypothetical protein